MGSVWKRIAEHVRARPWTVKAYVATGAIFALWSVASPDVRENPSRLLVHVTFLLGVWMGSRFVWVIALAGHTLSLVAALALIDGPLGIVLVGVLALSIGLLVSAPTWRWINLGKPVPVPFGGP